VDPAVDPTAPCATEPSSRADRSHGLSAWGVDARLICRASGRIPDPALNVRHVEGWRHTSSSPTPMRSGSTRRSSSSATAATPASRTGAAAGKTAATKPSFRSFTRTCWVARSASRRSTHRLGADDRLDVRLQKASRSVRYRILHVAAVLGDAGDGRAPSRRGLPWSSALRRAFLKLRRPSRRTGSAPPTRQR